jgi:hypothetical protein
MVESAASDIMIIEKSTVLSIVQIILVSSRVSGAITTHYVG